MSAPNLGRPRGQTNKAGHKAGRPAGSAGKRPGLTVKWMTVNDTPENYAALKRAAGSLGFSKWARRTLTSEAE